MKTLASVAGTDYAGNRLVEQITAWAIEGYFPPPAPFSAAT